MPRISNPQNFAGEDLISKQSLGLTNEDVLATARTNYTSGAVDDKVIAAEYLPEVLFNNKGTVETKKMGPKIKFIGDCNVVQDPVTGELIIRIGENLNSSVFNNTDGQTNGTAKYTDNNPTYPVKRITNAANAQNVWLKGTSDTVTITTENKIHFDNTTSTFKVLVTANDEQYEYICGPVTGNGTFGTAPCVLTVSNWANETNQPKGATGYEANISILLTLSSIVTQEGPVSFKVTCEGTASTQEYAKTVAYFIVDKTTMPSVSDFTAKLTSKITQTWAGITSLKSGTVTYSATVANLNTPATDASTGASIKIDNTSNYAADVAKVAQTVYDGTVITGGVLTTTAGIYSTFNASFTAWNILSSAVATTDKLLDSNGNQITAYDMYAGTPDASITKTNRITLDSTTKADKVAYTDTAAPGTDDLMVYHGALQYPSAFITNSYLDNTEYSAPSTTGDKSALFWFAATGTENTCTLTINGSGLNGANVKSITFGNSVANLKSLSGYTDNGSSEAADKLVYKFSYKTDADKATSDTGVFVKVVFSGTGPKITSITKSL